jgi:hypothetical protein
MNGFEPSGLSLPMEEPQTQLKSMTRSRKGQRIMVNSTLFAVSPLMQLPSELSQEQLARFLGMRRITSHLHLNTILNPHRDSSSSSASVSASSSSSSSAVLNLEEKILSPSKLSLELPITAGDLAKLYQGIVLWDIGAEHPQLHTER